jgi:CheY-like chemotaxis protein
MREIIFERFRQIDESSRRHKGGTGLGLAIVKEFVTLHKGNIKVVDSAKGGTKFIVTLPIKAPIGFTVAKDHKANDTKIDKLFVTEFGNYDTTRTKAILSHTHTKHKELILVVEDNYDMNTFLTQILSSLNYRVETAYNGKEGLEKALRQLPDLIISDVMMPEMNGEEMALALLAHPETKNIPLLMLTAKMDNALKIGLLKEGVQDLSTNLFLQKNYALKWNGLLPNVEKELLSMKGLYSN